MLKFLISATNEIRVETMQDVEALHKQLQDEADEIGCLSLIVCAILILL